jgi:hypothetical protein
VLGEQRAVGHADCEHRAGCGDTLLYQPIDQGSQEADVIDAQALTRVSPRTPTPSPTRPVPASRQTPPPITPHAAESVREGDCEPGGRPSLRQPGQHGHTESVGASAVQDQQQRRRRHRAGREAIRPWHRS